MTVDSIRLSQDIKSESEVYTMSYEDFLSCINDSNHPFYKALVEWISAYNIQNETLYNKKSLNFENNKLSDIQKYQSLHLLQFLNNRFWSQDIQSIEDDDTREQVQWYFLEYIADIKHRVNSVVEESLISKKQINSSLQHSNIVEYLLSLPYDDIIIVLWKITSQTRNIPALESTQSIYNSRYLISSLNGKNTEKREWNSKLKKEFDVYIKNPINPSIELSKLLQKLNNYCKERRIDKQRMQEYLIQTIAISEKYKLKNKWYDKWVEDKRGVRVEKFWRIIDGGQFWDNIWFYDQNWIKIILPNWEVIKDDFEDWWTLEWSEACTSRTSLLGDIFVHQDRLYYVGDIVDETSNNNNKIIFYRELACPQERKQLKFNDNPNSVIQHPKNTNILAHFEILYIVIGEEYQSLYIYKDAQVFELEIKDIEVGVRSSKLWAWDTRFLWVSKTRDGIILLDDWTYLIEYNIIDKSSENIWSNDGWNEVDFNYF